jgi:hypothetical protein
VKVTLAQIETLARLFDRGAAQRSAAAESEQRRGHADYLSDVPPPTLTELAAAAAVAAEEAAASGDEEAAAEAAAASEAAAKAADEEEEEALTTKGTGGPFLPEDAPDAYYEAALGRMETLLAPLLVQLGLSPGPGRGSGDTLDSMVGKHVVVVASNPALALPLELLQCLAYASSVSRDFSMHMLHHRISACCGTGADGGGAAAAAGELAVAAKKDMAYVVDAFHDDLLFGVAEGRGGDERLDAKQEEDSVGARFADALGKFGAVGAKGLQGQEGAPPPTAGEQQRLLVGASLFMSFGLERYVSTIGTSTLARLDLSSVNAALMLDGASNSHSYARQNRADNRKSRQELWRVGPGPLRTGSLLDPE